MLPAVVAMQPACSTTSPSLGDILPATNTVLRSEACVTDRTMCLYLDCAPLPILAVRACVRVLSSPWWSEELVLPGIKHSSSRPNISKVLPPHLLTVQTSQESPWLPPACSSLPSSPLPWASPPPATSSCTRPARALPAASRTPALRTPTRL